MKNRFINVYVLHTWKIQESEYTQNKALNSELHSSNRKRGGGM